jgi:drug/metabolite transporter (DMT)-like permease
MQAGYLGGVWSAIKLGAGAGTVALLVGLQPVLTAVWLTGVGQDAAQRISARTTPRQWAGVLLGLAGVTLVLWPKLGVGELTAMNLSLALLALLSITAGTLYQKRFVGPCDVRCATIVQLLAALLVCAPLALLEPGSVRFEPQLIGAMAWSVLGLTLGGSSLLYLLIQRGAATEVSSLMYLVPPCTSLLGWLLFDEVFTPVMLLGLVMAAAGVAWVSGRPGVVRAA